MSPPPSPSPSSREAPARRLITIDDFEHDEYDNVEVKNLIKAHRKTLDDKDWTSLDDTELELYVKHRLYRKDKPHNKNTPVNHTLYRNMNAGPQYQTRAGHLFVHALWEHHNLAAFDKAVEKYGFAAAAPNGLLRLGDSKGWEKPDRPAPRDWPDDKPKVVEVFRDAIKACKQPASRRSKDFIEVKYHTTQSFAPLSPSKLTVPQRSASPEVSSEEHDEFVAPETEAPAKRSRRDRTSSLTPHSLAPKATAKRALSDVDVDYAPDIVEPKPASKKVRFTSNAENEPVVRQLPDFSRMQVKRPVPKEKPADKIQELMKQLEDHALQLTGLRDTTTHINTQADSDAIKNGERVLALKAELNKLKDQNIGLENQMDAMKEEYHRDISELKEFMEMEMTRMKNQHLQETNESRELIWELFEKLREQGVLTESGDDA